MFLLNFQFLLYIFSLGVLQLFYDLSVTAIVHERYTRSIDDYEIVIPRKVTEDGVFITHYIPHFYDTKRKKRDLQSEQVNYIVPISGTDYHVQLWPSSHIFAPGLVVEDHYGVNNASQIKFRRAASNQCHFNGIVKGVDRSRVALSACYGLAGFIRVPTEEYVIEPHLNSSEEEEYAKHYVYKRSAIVQNRTTNCGTVGRAKEALVERLEWESKYGVGADSALMMNLMKNPQMNMSGILERRRRSVHHGDCPMTVECTTENCPPQDIKCLKQAALFMELMIVVDYRIEKIFTNDIEAFTFTVVNMVVTNFHDQSMGVPIHAQIVRLISLKIAEPNLDIFRYSPLKLLANFCQWQFHFNPMAEEHPNHHDFAILITRFEPCQGRLLGLTNMASVCRPDKGCAVVSEDGLLVAYVMTHQIAHALGADHDDGECGGCAAVEEDGTGYFMNPIVTMSASEWSICSRQSFELFTSSHISWCLQDAPTEHDFNTPDILPGQVYDAVQQCTLNYNMRTLACKIGEFCKILYCQISPHRCATTGDPPAIGTPCAQDMWCFRGNCVQRGQRPGAVNGEWGPWSRWSDCTRSCGGGVQARYRGCTNPAPSHGGTYCLGKWLTFKLCHTQPCLGYSVNFLQQQCKMTDRRPYKGRYYMWNYFNSNFQDVKCMLVCINERREVTVRSPVVVDGSPCDPGTNNVCIQGTCKDVGCDHVIDSKSKFDSCGFCHGNGTACRIIQGLFSEPNVRGVTTFLKLPTGTSMIFVRELFPSTCYLVASGMINSTFYLNNPLGCDQLPGEFDFGGTTGIYEITSDVERIFVKGGIKTPMTIMVKCDNETNKGVRYQYALPERDPTYTPYYYWLYLSWTACSQECDGGAQRARPACVEAKGGEVEDRYCVDTIRPQDVIRSCNKQPCTARWWVGPWSGCDCTDGEGIRVRMVFCIRTGKLDSLRFKIVKDKECCRSPRPRVQKPCGGDNEMDDDFDNQRYKKDLSSIFYEKMMNDSGPLRSDIFGHRRKKSLDIGRDIFKQYQFDGDPDFDIEEKTDDSNFRALRGEPHGKIGNNKKRAHKHMKKTVRKMNSTRMASAPVEKMVGSERPPERHHEAGSVSPRRHRLKPQKGVSPGVGTTETPAVTRLDRENRTEATAQTQAREKNVKKADEDKISVDKACCTTCKIKTTCGPEMTVQDLEEILLTISSCMPTMNPEPADLLPVIEGANNTAYKLVIVPLVRYRDNFQRTELELRQFGDAANWPVANDDNKIMISGLDVLKTMQEARKRATRPPHIESLGTP